MATPIGNLEDLTLRALRVLREVPVVAAEDTRHTRKLLAHFDLHARLVAYHAHSGPAAAERLLRELAAGTDVALVTDAGTPGISDPGTELVAAAAAAGVRVVPVPGPSAVTAALSAAGFPAQRFRFEGFPPRAARERRRFFADLARADATLVLYEAPQRLLATLEAVAAAFGDRPLVVARELTKQFEELFRGTAAAAAAHFGAAPVRGECVLVIAPAAAPPPAAPSAPDLHQRAAALLASGLSKRDAAGQLAAEAGIPRREAYAAVLGVGRGAV